MTAGTRNERAAFTDIEAETSFLPIKMQQIDSFCAMLSYALENTPASEGKPITICSGSKTAEALTNACLLVGSPNRRRVRGCLEGAH